MMSKPRKIRRLRNLPTFRPTHFLRVSRRVDGERVHLSNPKHKNPNPKKIPNSKHQKGLRFHKHRRKKAMLWASTVTYVAGTYDGKTLRVSYCSQLEEGCLVTSTTN
jgi:hypothetical protein